MNHVEHNYQATRFITSAANIHQLPEDSGIEIAFVGRSNAGKSSALNTLANQKQLARISKTPGRTQLINLFELVPGKRLVDLPGYGYAEVSEAIKQKWQQSLASYLQSRRSLRGLVLLMDIRHPLKDLDQHMIQWSVAAELPVFILLTKADKLANGPRKLQLERVQEAILVFQGDIEVEAFSSVHKMGVDKLKNKLDSWFGVIES